MSSTRNLNILIPHRQRIVLSTTDQKDKNHQVDRIEILFLVRIGIYVAVVGALIIIVFLILKYLGICNDIQSQTGGDEQLGMITPGRGASESEPPMAVPEPEKIIGLPYGTDKDDNEGRYYNNTTGRSSSSDDLYDRKICVICYDIVRNCFFVPCGHCATCHDCAMRIMEGENKVCPICRRFIHKVKRLLMP